MTEWVRQQTDATKEVVTDTMRMYLEDTTITRQRLQLKMSVSLENLEN